MEGQFLLHAGRTDEAIARLREAIEIDPKSRVGHMFLASAYIERGLFSEAIVEAGAASALSPATRRSPMSPMQTPNSANGRKRGTHWKDFCIYRRNVTCLPTTSRSPTWGWVSASEALTWLDRAFEERDPRMVFLKVEPKWKSLHDNGRYARLLNRMNLLS